MFIAKASSLIYQITKKTQKQAGTKGDRIQKWKHNAHNIYIYIYICVHYPIMPWSALCNYTCTSYVRLFWVAVIAMNSNALLELELLHKHYAGQLATYTHCVYFSNL